MTEPTTKYRCPHCRHLLPTPYEVAPNPRTEPIPDAAAVCPYCGETAIFDENLNLRKATETELEELELNQLYRMIRTRARRSARANGTLTADPEGLDDTDLESALLEIPLRLGVGGDLEVGEIPPSIRDLILPVLRDIRTQMVGEDIKANVTPEIANYVLSAYGNEQASMPSIAVGALISLIRLCKDSDDYLLSRLDDVEGIHGYVLAVTALAETPPEGMEILELLAGLRDPDDLSEQIVK